MAGERWLLFMHQLPAKPDYLRVKLWRRIQRLGAVPLKHSVWALPNTEVALEDFQWLRREVDSDGGEAMICKAEIVAGLGAEPRAALMELAQRMEARALAALEDLRSETTEPVTSVEPGQTWVTRRGIGVDRMASAWLIRRSIDPQATFRFESDDFVPKDGELRFDMYEGEFTHVADLCTFEVLVDTFVPGDPVLTAIGEVVHDIDLKDALFKRPETVGVAALIEGIQATQHDDDARLARGFLLFDELHAALERRLSLMTD